ncbi:MAG: S8 family serine peptidase [Bythopirellula sp.]|nr:S8 family serine peptidase [Bythopirellula sp.]
MRKAAKNLFAWKGSIETLEDRRVMSADPLLGGSIEHHYFEDDEAPQIEHQLVAEPDFWLDIENLVNLEEQLNEIEQTLYSAHNTTGLNTVVTNYGFTGIGQTVAVIDSGIAYDHFALGGGFGANYRVVGGWDFTGENDANPYDDGPSGSHGTHVAGIIGGGSGNDKGVASGVDLVALRVFDDAGAGYFSWVENALRWVINNRTSFENPITAINLSLGVASWNSNTIPSWSTLEDEFQQLEAAGVFIAVSAGNSYASYNAPGLSYPAASPYVVPVMSVTDAGVLASYSQRDVRGIAAPGSQIRSTVPDYKGNNNGITDDYANFSGTSMASPYIAGASVLIRQAMQFVGQVNITQDNIYDHMMATATSFVDASTGLTFKRLNLGAAISALMPTDDYGSTTATAHNLGSLSGAQNISGVISTLGDLDYLKFTATANGTATFAASNLTHQMDVAWSLANGTGTLSNNGDTFSFDVVAGQTYTVGVSSTGGLGYYNLEITAESQFTFTDWGAISFSQLNNLAANGETWYRVQASQAGYLTVESMFGTTSGQINLHLYNANMQLVDSGNAANGTSRVDAYATAGQEFYLCALGTNADVDYRLSNLVTVSDTTVNIAGTNGNDTFAFTAGNTHTVTVNGVTHDFAAIAVNRFNFNGGNGLDTITMTGTTGNETAILSANNGTFNGTGFTVSSLYSEIMSLYGGGGADSVQFYDTPGNDVFIGKQSFCEMTSSVFVNRAYGFSNASAYAYAGGYDKSELYDTPGNDQFQGKPTASYIMNSNYFRLAANFDDVYVYSIAGGVDTAELYDSAQDDIMVARPDYAALRSALSFNFALNFEKVYAYSTGGNDTAFLYDSAGNDFFVGRPTFSCLYGNGFYNYAQNFKTVRAFSNAGGNDSAWLYGSASDDRLDSYAGQHYLALPSSRIEALSFENANIYGMGGNDVSKFHNVSSADQIFGSGNLFRHTRVGSITSLYDFDDTDVFLLAGATPSVNVQDIDYLFEQIGS